MRIFQLAFCLIVLGAFARPLSAQDTADAVYVVTYIEVMPSADGAAATALLASLAFGAPVFAGDSKADPAGKALPVASDAARTLS